jgi:hypothetical protein
MGVRTFNKEITWDKVEQMLAVIGWTLVEKKKNHFDFAKGIEHIISFRTVGGKWKSDYFVGRKLRDSTGVNDAHFAKLITMELALSKQYA